MTTPDKLHYRDPHSGAAVPFQIKAASTASGDTAVPLAVPTGRKIEITGFKIISLNTTASNVKLKKNNVDICAVTAKSGTDHGVVLGGNLDIEAALFTASDELEINQSGAGSIVVIFDAVWTTE